MSEKRPGKGAPPEDALSLLEEFLLEEYGLSEPRRGSQDWEKPQLGERTKKILDISLLLIGRLGGDHVGAYAASAAYFFILSFLPFVMFLTAIIRYTDLTYAGFVQVINATLPETVRPFVLELITEAYSRNRVLLPMSTVLTLWTAGKAIQSLINGLNTIYHVKETRNWLINRIYAVFFTMLFAVIIISSLVLLFFGGRLHLAVKMLFPHLAGAMEMLMGKKSLLMGSTLFFLFVMLYKILPNRQATFKSQAPGALIVAAAWTIFSDLFSIYYGSTSSATNMYGNMTTLILIMIWLYFCMFFLLIGAELNACFEDAFRRMSQQLWVQYQERRYQRRKRRRRQAEPYLTDPDAESRFDFMPQEPARGAEEERKANGA
ncbi:MAG: YihY/virulence factor BrkB family protein [Blautia sp.]|nr:YihY/virulence factor BrkB family protein [Blautia sp.]